MRKYIKDNVKMPVIGKGLPERVEKVREESTDIDLETASLSEIINMRKKTKNKKSKYKRNNYSNRKNKYSI